MSFFATPEFYSATLYTIGLISLPIHAFGAYCILFQTPEFMKSVKWSLLNLHFWSSYTDLIVSLLTQPYILKSTWAGIPLGILKNFGVSLPVQSYLVATGFTLTSVAIITIFENRYYLIFGENTWWKYGRMVFLVFNYTLALVYYIPTVLTVPSQEDARRQTFELYPELRAFDSKENPIFVLVAYGDSSVSTRQILTEGIILIEAFSLVGMLSWKMKTQVKNMKLSESTEKMQRAFLNTIYIQTFVPFLVIAVPSITSIFSGFLEISTQSVNNLVYITFWIHGLTSTLIMLTIQKPYRQFCLRIIRPKYWSSQNQGFNSIAAAKPTLF